MYYNFAATSTAIYGNVTVEEVEADEFKALEINGARDYRMVQLDEEFGQIQFWNEIEERLVASDGWRLSNLFSVTVTLMFVVVLGTN